MSDKELLELVTGLSKLLKQAGKGEHLTCQEAERILQGIKNYLYRNYRFAETLEQMGVFRVAFRRLVPLVTTLCIALGTSFVLSRHEATLGELAKFFVFAPLVSAICGNNGLQTGTIVIRALAVGSRKGILKALVKEMCVGLVLGLVVGLMGGFIASMWLNEWKMLMVVGGALLSGILTSSFMGSVMPILFERFNIDPALTVGPAESTIQDIISYSVYLTMLKLLLG